MRKKKVRGLRKRTETIEQWRRANLRLNIEQLMGSRCHYIRLAILPWYRLSFTNSQYPYPSAGFRHQMLSAMLDIFDTWKEQLDKLSLPEPYYLAIWLYHDDFMRSQVYCSLDESWGHNMFNRTEQPRSFPIDAYRPLIERIDRLQWNSYRDEFWIFSSELIEEPELATKIERAAPDQLTISTVQFRGSQEKAYGITKGTVWVGTVAPE